MAFSLTGSTSLGSARLLTSKETVTYVATWG